MKQLFSYSLCIAFSILAFNACTPKEQKSTPSVVQEKVDEGNPTIQPGFVHAVYFWLKKDNPALLKEFLDEGLPKLAKVPSIQSVAWGPAAGSPRDVVDNSYDLAWIVDFANKEAEAEYQVDPLHLEFVEKYKSLFEKVIVYDNIVEKYSAN
ncbi:MAG: Dabb family protein [Saprospiraceae bacterium]|nr:Dabb family protein [Saprospiraceae bacterium]